MNSDFKSKVSQSSRPSRSSQTNLNKRGKRLTASSLSPLRQRSEVPPRMKLVLLVQESGTFGAVGEEESLASQKDKTSTASGDGSQQSSPSKVTVESSTRQSHSQSPFSAPPETPSRPYFLLRVAPFS